MQPIQEIYEHIYGIEYIKNVIRFFIDRLDLITKLNDNSLELKEVFSKFIDQYQNMNYYEFTDRSEEMIETMISLFLVIKTFNPPTFEAGHITSYYIMLENNINKLIEEFNTELIADINNNIITLRSVDDDIWDLVNVSVLNNNNFDIAYLGIFELKISIIAENIFKKVELKLQWDIVADSRLISTHYIVGNLPNRAALLAADNFKQNMYIGLATEINFFMTNFRLDNKFVPIQFMGHGDFLSFDPININNAYSSVVDKFAMHYTDAYLYDIKTSDYNLFDIYTNQGLIMFGHKKWLEESLIKNINQRNGRIQYNEPFIQKTLVYKNFTNNNLSPRLSFQSMYYITH